MPSISDRLIAAREEKKKSRAEAAKELNISYSALQMYESGQRVPRDNIKINMAAYYNKTVSELFY